MCNAHLVRRLFTQKRRIHPGLGGPISNPLVDRPRQKESSLGALHGASTRRLLSTGPRAVIYPNTEYSVLVTVVQRGL